MSATARAGRAVIRRRGELGAGRRCRRGWGRPRSRSGSLTHVSGVKSTGRSDRHTTVRPLLFPQLRSHAPSSRPTVRRRDSAPARIPPDWHHQEQATTRGMGMVQRVRGVPFKVRDGSQITVQGNDVVGRSSAGTSRPLTASNGYALHGTNPPPRSATPSVMGVSDCGTKTWLCCMTESRSARRSTSTDVHRVGYISSRSPVVR